MLKFDNIVIKVRFIELKLVYLICSNNTKATKYMISSATIPLKTVNIDSIAIEAQELAWEGDYKDDGSVYHTYYRRDHDYHTEDYRIEAELNVSMTDYVVDDVWVGKIRLWSDDGIVALSQEQDSQLRKKLEQKHLYI